MIHRKKNERGNALLELALGWSVLWLLFAGVYQFGSALYVYNRLEAAVGSAAVLASRLDYDTSNTSAFTTKVVNMVVYGDPVGGTQPQAPNLTAANVNVTINYANTFPVDVTITIQNYSIDAFFRSFALNNKPRVSTVYMGKVTCSGC